MIIERIFLKNLLTFPQAELEPGPGLMIFSGPSGAGKSVLMNGILALFALKEAKADLAEATLAGTLDLSPFGLENEEEGLVVRQIKKGNVRYYVNSQNAGKGTVKELMGGLVRHLNLKDDSELKSDNLLALVDGVAGKKKAAHLKTLARYREVHQDATELSARLEELVDQERKVEELKEFARFEMDKIFGLDPKEGEFEELMEVKKRLSRKEKIAAVIQEAERIFDFEGPVAEAYELLGEDPTAFSDAMNEARSVLEEGMAKMEELDEVDVEEVLDRIEKLSGLNRRYGGVAEALAYADEKKKELASYESLEEQKKEVSARLKAAEKEREELAAALSAARKKAAPELEKAISGFLEKLYLSKAVLSLEPAEYGRSGADRAALGIGGTDLENISAGEFNRLRLALLAAGVRYQAGEGGKILFLDEIDANLSGEESARVASVLKYLSGEYQIFAISHQSQLTSQADKHFYVSKENGVSGVRELDRKERIGEIARIISGEAVTDEALAHAEKLLKG